MHEPSCAFVKYGEKHSSHWLVLVWQDWQLALQACALACIWL